MITRSLWLLAIPFVVVACDDKKVDPTAASASAALSASAPVASASAAPSADVAASATAAAAAAATAIPSQADEALKAEKEIDKANYKSELDKLDKEITAK